MRIMTLKEWNADIERSILVEAERTFGASYLTATYLRSFLVEPDKRMIFIGSEWGFHAVSLLCVYDKGDEHIPEELTGHDRVGHRKITMVHPDRTGMGLGRRVVEKGEEWFEEAGIPSFSLLWENPSNGGIAMLIESQDYEPQRLVPKAWSKESMERQFSCAVCGNPPCECDATLYIREV